MRIEQLDLSEWRDALPDSGIEVFHRPAALTTLDDHVAGDLTLYAGYKGQEPIGLCPVFTASKVVGTTVTSPPPSMNVPRLGPIVMPTSPKQRKRERVNRDFIETMLTEMEIDGRLSLFRTVCHNNYTDPRPYLWENYDLTTRYTYILDLADRTREDVLASFSSSLRRDIRDGLDQDVRVSIEGMEAAREVYERTKARYEEQGQSFPLSWEYVRDLIENLDDNARVYVSRGPDGEFLGGVTALYSTDNVYFWQGGTRADYDGTSVNSPIHWRIITDVLEDPNLDHITGYDLMGANTKRLCPYKSRFAADLVPYYVVESDSVGMDVAKATYQTLKR